METAKYNIVIVSSPHDIPITLFYDYQFRERESPLAAALNTGGV